jgi:hypothetical protein
MSQNSVTSLRLGKCRLYFLSKRRALRNSQHSIPEGCSLHNTNDFFVVACMMVELYVSYFATDVTHFSDPF